MRASDKAVIRKGNLCRSWENKMPELPIFSKKKEILNAIRANQVTIVVGETGSGKTTQIPAFLYEDGYSVSAGKIGVTQPRRIAATSVAAFVAKQLGTELGDIVGYQIRFDDKTADRTQVKFMTDGILLQEIQRDTELSQYSVIMVDEAHERSENIDFLLGLLKELLKRRTDLKVVVASATIDEQKFSQYFGNAPIVNVSGRMYPVEIVWSEKSFFGDYLEDVIDAVIGKVVEIHKAQESGDVLVFMTGRDDINSVVEGLEKLGLENLVVLPVYGELSIEDQQKIFNRYSGKRKIVVATNIAETSITVEGISYVVDSGFIKQSNFHSDTGIKSLDVVEHSQSGCNQRTGRAGRVQSGVCYRMYTQQNFEKRSRFTTPEILRVSLADVVLKIENIGIADVEGFDFIEPPDHEAFHEAYETLIALGAIQRGVKGLTDIGRAMARLPLDPRTSRMVLEAQKYGCVKNVATIAAFLSVRNVFSRPKGNEYEADLAHAQFKDEKSDALTFLNIWGWYEASSFDSQWCYSNFLNPKTMREVAKIRTQLFQILYHHGIELTESKSQETTAKAVTMGLAYNLFEHFSRGAYRGIQRTNAGYVYIHPSSRLFRSGQRFIVATEIVRTSKVWGRICTAVEPEWLPELVPHLCTTENPCVEFWNPGDVTVKIRQDIVYNGYAIHSVRKTVSLEEAIKIQNENIRKAERKGYIHLTFSKVKVGSLYAFEKWIAYYDGNIYQTHDHVGEGIFYLCQVEDFLGEKYALPKIRLFNFPKSSPSVSSGSNKPTIEAPASVVESSPLNLLAAKWGAKRLR